MYSLLPILISTAPDSPISFGKPLCGPNIRVCIESVSSRSTLMLGRTKTRFHIFTFFATHYRNTSPWEPGPHGVRCPRGTFILPHTTPSSSAAVSLSEQLKSRNVPRSGGFSPSSNSGKRPLPIFKLNAPVRFPETCDCPHESTIPRLQEGVSTRWLKI